MRAISADDLIERLDAVCDTSCPYSKKQRSVMCGSCMLGSAFDVVDDMPTLHKIPNEPQWIPMSEREPEFGNYLTTFRKKGDPEDKRDVTIDLYWSGGWDDDGTDGDDTVFETLAWMPLPECYKGE